MSHAAQTEVTAEYLEGLSLEDLFNIEQHFLARAAVIKEKVSLIVAEKARRFMADLKKKYDDEGKDTGTMTIALENGMKVKCEIGKTVKFDQEKMQALASKLAWQEVARIMKLTLEVPAKNLKELPVGEVKTAIEEAMTVTPNTPKITLIKEG